MSSQDVLLPYAEQPDGRLVSVDEVERGAACGCICPQCRAPVIARRGDILAHHFAHAAPTDCSKPLETILHRLGKQMIADAGWIVVPGYIQDGSPIIREMSVTATLIETEKAVGPVRPDLLFHRGAHTLAIEIRVTHSPDDDKIAALRALVLPTLEIDLSKVDRDAIDRMTPEYVLREAPRSWLYHPKIDHEQAKEVQRRLAVRGAALEQRITALDARQRDLERRERQLDEDRQCIEQTWASRRQILEDVQKERAETYAKAAEVEAGRRKLDDDRRDVAGARAGLHEQIANCSPVLAQIFEAWPDAEFTGVVL
jgi:hypothetical protein